MQSHPVAVEVYGIDSTAAEERMHSVAVERCGSESAAADRCRILPVTAEDADVKLRQLKSRIHAEALKVQS